MVTIEIAPASYMPAYNPLRYVISSDNTAQPNFKFVCDLYINSVLVKRLKRPKHPDFDSAMFDVHRIVESFVSDDKGITATDGFYRNTNSWCDIYIQAGEEYGLASSGATVYPDQEQSGIVYAWNGSIDSLDFIGYQGGEYTLGNPTSLFIHSFPTYYDGMRGALLERGQYFNLYMMIENTNTVDKLVIITYDDSRSMIDEYQIDNDWVTIGADSNRFLRCAIGYNANNIDSGKLTTGTQPIFTSDVKYFKVYTVNTVPGVSSEELYFEYSDACSNFDTFEIHWLDPLGGFNSFVFTHAHTENVKIDRKQYKQQVGTMSASLFTVTKADRGYQNYFTSSNSELKVRSGWITEDMFSFLRYMKESPQVFIRSGSDFISVNVTDSNYEVKQTLNTNLINFELTLKYSVDNYKQRY